MGGLAVASNIPGLEWGMGSNVVQGCGCAMCAALSQDTAGSPHVMASATTTATGGTRGATMIEQYQDADGMYLFTGDRNIDAVLIGSKWTSTELTFSFPTYGSSYGAGYDLGQAALTVQFNDAQQAAAREGFALISSYTNLTFTELAPDSEERPTLRLASTAQTSVASAMGYFPHTAGDVGGDIWFGRTEQPYYETPERGNWGFATILHEIGHTLGLKHGHSDYTVDDMGSFFGLDQALFGTRALEYDKDGQLWSLMTYTSAPNTSPDFNGDGQSQPQTYMMYDIAALQFLYGANYATNAGDTVYKWNPSTGALSINGVSRGDPAGNVVNETVWDGGGNDTYDLSSYTGGLSLDLRPGAISALPMDQRPNALGYLDGYAPMSGNIGNALLYNGNTASLIENAIGGSGNDRIVGNQANNRLEGGAGDDALAGAGGSDLLIGGAGNDTVDFTGAASGISISFNNGGADIVVANGQDRDVLRGVEGAIGTTFDDRLTGDRAGNLLSGGSGGRDVLNGKDGNDTLIGARDTIVQIGKADLIKTIDQISWTQQTALNLDGSFDLVRNDFVERSEEIPHATVQAVGMSGTSDMYRFTATAGDTAIFDIDGAPGGYTAIEILDEAGNLIGNNFEDPRSDEGSRDGGSPFLEFEFLSSGTFYVRVGRLDYYRDENDDLQPMLVVFREDQPYVLNVSVESARVDSQVTAIGSGEFYGGKDDDLIVGATGDDLIDGGWGSDTLSYANARNRVTVDLSRTTAQDTGAGRDTISGIENLTGSRFDDTLRGDAGNNIINGGGGNDWLSGGAGRDTLSFAGQTTGVFFSLGAQGQLQSTAPGMNIFATGFENVHGGDGDDWLTGDAGSNYVRGWGGDDVLSGSNIDAVGVIDTLDGGEGTDIASFASYDRNLVVRLSSDGTGQARTAGNTLFAKLIGMEGIEGGRGNDQLFGSGLGDRLSGGEGNDQLRGGGGDDVLEGGAGDDRVEGGDGNNTAIYGAFAFHYIDLAVSEAQFTGEGQDILKGIQNLRGGWDTDMFFGNDDANIFFDVGGSDYYVGRGGSDTVDYSTARRMVSVDLTTDSQQDVRGGGYDTLSGIENIRGGDFGNVLLGDAANNGFVGGAGLDVLIGGLGADRLEGGDGDDLLIGEDSNFTDNPDGVSLNDVLIGGRGADQLVGGEGDDMLFGGSGNDVLIGGGAVYDRFGDTFLLEGLLLMDGGRDSLDGGDGLDSGVLFYAGRKEAISIDMRDTAATNDILFDGTVSGTITSVETLRFFGGVGADRVLTSAGYDVLQGGAGNDYLSSGEGDDVINGGSGDDWLDGGYGVDTISYSGAAAGITIDLRRTDAQDTGGDGIDTIRGFENVVTTAFDDTVYATDFGNTITDTTAGNDTFFGFGGNDSLTVVRIGELAAQTILIDGGDGADLLQYASGPVYDVRIPSDQYRNIDSATVLGGAGNDLILYSGQKTGIIDAGSGDDEVRIGIGGLADTSLDITLGEGRDALWVRWTSSDLGAIDRFDNIVRDFQAGAGGDDIQLNGLLAWVQDGTNLFSANFLRLVQNGDDVQLQIDADAAGEVFQWRTFLTFQNTQATDFTDDNFFATTGDGYFDPIVVIPIDPTLQGSAGAGTGFVPDMSVTFASAVAGDATDFQWARMSVPDYYLA